MKVHLLIVDDEQEIGELLSRRFRFLGYLVDVAENGKEALEIMERTKIDIVVSDISMPEMDGIELLRTIRHQYPMVHVIMMTGYVTLDNALSCARLGADTCVFKPLDELKELEEAIDSAVAAIRKWLGIFHVLMKMKPDAVGENR